MFRSRSSFGNKVSRRLISVTLVEADVYLYTIPLYIYIHIVVYEKEV